MKSVSSLKEKKITAQHAKIFIERCVMEQMCDGLGFGGSTWVTGLRKELEKKPMK